MFFIGIFGVNGFNKKLADVIFKCPGCTHEKAEVVETAKTFSFFFIPLYVWKKSFYVSCNNCKSIYKLKSENIKKILEAKEVAYEDIDSIILENRSCDYCGARLERDYKYCPHCGTKQEKN